MEPSFIPIDITYSKMAAMSYVRETHKYKGLVCKNS